MEIKLKIRFKFFHKTIGFRFDMLSWWKLCDVNSVELGELGKIPQDDIIKDMIFAAHHSYCFSHNKKMKYTREQCRAWYKKMSITDGEKFAQGILQSKLFTKTTEQWIKEADKSKKK